MKANRPKKSWNLMSRVIWPSIYFVSGVLFSAVLLGGLHDPVESSTAAPGLQTRVVELMGRVNDLEGTVGDLEHQLKGAETQHLLCLGDLQNTKMEVSKADKAADKARQLAAAGKAGGACPPCASGCASGCASAGGDEGAEPDWASSPAKDWASETEEEAKWGREVAAKGDKGGGQAAVKWSPVGRKWQATELEPVSFMNKFDIGLPIETIKWSGGQLLVPSPKRGRLEETGTALDHIDHDCNELDVMVLNDQHCVAVTHVNGAAAGHSTPYHINRFLKGGYKAKKWGKKSAVPEGEWEFVSRLTSKSGSNEGAPPGDGSIKTHRKALNRFLTSVDDVESKLGPILAKAAKARGDNTVMTMTMNAGMTDLVLNFVCSAKRAGHSIDHLVLFPTDQEAVEVAKSLGVAHFSHPSFGDFPKEEARSYGDNTFVKMMWIKVLCVYLPIDLGFNVLFQDADVVWLRDPIQEYFLDPKVAGDFDVYFQDDGSRSTRFSPYFSNSGFYFLRAGPRTRYFMTSLLYGGDQILEWRSHQSALVQILADCSSKFGLKVKTLSYADFPSGKDYHHRKPYMQKWLQGEEHPYAFHMCWTQNKVDKVKYLKQLGGWFMERTCNEDTLRSGELFAKGGLAQTCCTAEPVLDCFFKDKASKEPCLESPNKDKGAPSWWRA